VTAATLRAYKQPIRMTDGHVIDLFEVVALCPHGGARAAMSRPMFEDALFLAAFTRLEVTLHQATGCDCTAKIPPDIEVESNVEVSG